MKSLGYFSELKVTNGRTRGLPEVRLCHAHRAYKNQFEEHVHTSATDALSFHSVQVESSKHGVTSH
jgi:hypothetical protein